MAEENKIISRSPAHTMRLAEKFALNLPAGPVTVALYGELGSGKTCFAQGLASGLGVKQPVSSPTFTMVNEYQGDRRMFHADLYRISGPGELESLGLDECFTADAVTLVEWAERIEDYLPGRTVRLLFRIPDATASANRREITINDPLGILRRAGSERRRQKMRLLMVLAVAIMMSACGRCENKPDEGAGTKPVSSVRRTAEDVTGKTKVDSFVKTKQDISEIESAQKERLDKAPRPEKP